MKTQIIKEWVEKDEKYRIVGRIRDRDPGMADVWLQREDTDLDGRNYWRTLDSEVVRSVESRKRSNERHGVYNSEYKLSHEFEDMVYYLCLEDEE